MNNLVFPYRSGLGANRWAPPSGPARPKFSGNLTFDDATPTVVGKGVAGSTIDIQILGDDDVVLVTGQAVVDGSGNWSFTVPDGYDLTDPRYSVRARQTLPDGRVSKWTALYDLNLAPPSWLSYAGIIPAVPMMDFANNRYWDGGTSYASMAAFLASPNIRGSYARTGERIVRGANGAWSIVAANTPALAYGADGTAKGIRVDVARTNKITARTFNPTDTTNVSKAAGSDAAATVSVVSDTVALIAAGLAGVCSNGNVYRLNNTSGVVVSRIAFAGGAGNTNDHSMAAMIRGTGTGRIRSGYTQPNDGAFTLTSGYVRKVATHVSGLASGAKNSSDVIWVEVDAGADLYVILPEFVETTTLPDDVIIGSSTTSATAVGADDIKLGPVAHGGIDPANFKYVGAEAADVVVYDPTTYANVAAAQANGWAAQGDATLAVSANRVRATRNTNSYAWVTKALTGLTIGQAYMVSMTRNRGNFTSVSIYLQISAGSATGALYSSNSSAAGDASLTFTFVATQTSHWIGLVTAGGSSGDVLEIAGVTVSAGNSNLNGTQVLDIQDFASGTGSFVGSGTTTVANVSGELEVTMDATLAYATKTYTAVVGGWYRVTVSGRKGTSVNNVQMRVGVAVNSSVYGLQSYGAGAAVSKSLMFKATSTNLTVSLGYGQTAGGQTAYFDDLKVEQIAFADDFSSYADTAAMMAAGWTNVSGGSAVTLVSGGLLLGSTADGASARSAYILMPTVVGRRYRFRAQSDNSTNITGSNSCHIRATSADFSTVYAISPGQAMTTLRDHELTFVAGATTTALLFRWDGTSSGGVPGTVRWDNVSVEVLTEDRSVVPLHALQYGLLTQTPVAPGASLLAYAGFNSSNYLEIPYNVAFELGAGDHMVGCWVKMTPGAVNQIFLNRGLTTNGAYGFMLFADASGLAAFRHADSSSATVVSTFMINDGNWHFVVGIRRGSTVREIWVDGVKEVFGGTSKNINDAGGTAPLRVGRSTNTNTSGNFTSIALPMVSGYAPTDAEIVRKYRQEKEYFTDRKYASPYNLGQGFPFIGFDPRYGMLFTQASIDDPINPGAAQILASMSDGSVANRFQLQMDFGAGRLPYWFASKDSTTQAGIANGYAWDPKERRMIAARWQTDAFRMKDSTSPFAGTDTSAAVPNVRRMGIGSRDYDTSLLMRGYLEVLSAYPGIITDEIVSSMVMSAPSITAPGLTITPTPSIAGSRAYFGATIDIQVRQGATVFASGTTMADQNGNWSWTVPNGSPLEAGTYQVYARQTALGVTTAYSAAFSMVQTIPTWVPALASSPTTRAALAFEPASDRFWDGETTYSTLTAFLASPRIRGSYARTGERIVRGSNGQWAIVAANTRSSPFTAAGQAKGMRFDAACTNKITCQTFNPTVTTNLAKSGDGAATLTIVSDVTALAAAGLAGICTNGNVYKLDNSAGSGVARAEAQAPTVSTNPHSISVFMRGSGSASLMFNNVSATPTPITASYVRYKSENLTPSNGATTWWSIRAAAGAVVYFILMETIASPSLPDDVIIGSSNTSATAVGADDLKFGPVMHGGLDPANFKYVGAEALELSSDGNLAKPRTGLNGSSGLGVAYELDNGTIVLSTIDASNVGGWAVPLVTVAGMYYEVSFTSTMAVFNGVWDGFTLGVGGQVLLSGSSTTTSGVRTFVFQASDALSYFIAARGTAGTAVVSDLRIRQLTFGDSFGHANTAAMIAAGWIDASTTASVTMDAGSMLLTSSGGTARARRSITTVAGQRYKVTQDAPDGSVILDVGTTLGGTDLATASGVTGTNYAVYFTAAGTTTYMQYRLGGANRHVDNIRVEPVLDDLVGVQILDSQGFDSGTGGFTAVGDTGVANASGELQITATATNGYATKTYTVEVGSWYVLDITGRRANPAVGVAARIGTAANNTTYGELPFTTGSAVTLRTMFKALTTTLVVSLGYATNTNAGLFDNLLITKVTFADDFGRYADTAAMTTAGWSIPTNQVSTTAISLQSGAIRVASVADGSATRAAASPAIPTIPGRRYRARVSSGVGSGITGGFVRMTAYRADLLTAIVASSQLLASGAQTLEFTFVAQDTTSYLIPRWDGTTSGGVTGYIDFDNLIVEPLAEDRSATTPLHPTIYGTIRREQVAPGSNLAWYVPNGFGTNDFLQLPSPVAFGTGDWMIGCWVYHTDTSNTEVLFGQDVPGANATAKRVTLAKSSTGYNLVTGTSGTGAQATANGLVTGQPVFLLGVRRGNTIELWVNGVLAGSATNLQNDLTDANCRAVWLAGWPWNFTSPPRAGTKMAIPMIATGYAPTAAEVSRMYNQMLPYFDYRAAWASPFNIGAGFPFIGYDPSKDLVSKVVGEVDYLGFNHVFFQLTDGGFPANQNRILMPYVASSNSLGIFNFVNGGSLGSVVHAAATTAAKDELRMVARVKSGGNRIASNKDVASGTSNVYTRGSSKDARVGQDIAGSGNNLRGHIKTIAVIQGTVTDGDMDTLIT